MHVVTGHGPKTAERLELRRWSREETAWVRAGGAGGSGA